MIILMDNNGSVFAEQTNIPNELLGHCSPALAFLKGFFRRDDHFLDSCWSNPFRQQTLHSNPGVVFESVHFGPQKRVFLKIWVVENTPKTTTSRTNCWMIWGLLLLEPWMLPFAKIWHFWQLQVVLYDVILYCNCGSNHGWTIFQVVVEPLNLSGKGILMDPVETPTELPVLYFG